MFMSSLIGKHNCNIFADDAMIYSFGNDIIETEATLQSALDSLSPWYRANRLSINTNKSAVMLVGKHSQVHDASISIDINDVPLEQLSITKYLGVLVDGSLPWGNQYGTINAIIFAPELLVKSQFCAD